MCRIRESWEDRLQDGFEVDGFAAVGKLQVYYPTA